MQLVERHIIKPNHDLFKECDELAFKAKNLYNQGLYRVRQHFFKTGEYLNYNTLQKELSRNIGKKQVDYINLPAKVSQQVLRGLDKNFVSFFKANQSYQKHPSKFKGKPKIRRYKKKLEGRSVVTYTNQAISKVGLKKGLVQPSKTKICLSTKQTAPQQVRVVPKSTHYVIEVVYNKAEKEHIPNGKIAAIDLGLNNLVTMTFNFKEKPIIINGRPLKSINQSRYFRDKEKAKAVSHIGGKGRSNKTIKLDFKRNNKVNDYLHNSSRWLINHLVSLHITLLVIGWNKDMKQDINLGYKNNQNFVSIPFHKFIHQLQYKGQLEGIKVIVREESYTSKCSFLDGEPIKKHKTYQGKRVKRGLFRTAKGIYINADINASYNIMSKEFPIPMLRDF